MFKKVLSVVLAIATIACLFAACGKSKEKTILIGATGPLTGKASQYGESVKKGAQLAIDEINAAGGLNGIKLAFDMKDDKAEPDGAITGYDALMDAGMKISIGSVTAGACEAFADQAEKDNLFFITPSASADSIIKKGDNSFRVCFSDPQQGARAAQEIAKEYKNIGCIYDTSDTYSTGIYNAFKATLDNLGINFATQSYDADNNTDFSTQVEALKNCDVIFVPIYYSDAGLIAKTVVAKGSKAVVYGCDGLDGIAGQIEGVDVKVKYMTSFDANSTDETAAKFAAAYKAAYNNEIPDQFAADGYDAIYIVFNAMKNVGVDSVDIDRKELCDKVVAEITNPSFKYVGATGTMTWDASGSCTKEPVIVELGK